MLQSKEVEAMKEAYLEPELNRICFTSKEQIALDLEGGEGNELSGDNDGDFGLDILG
jgi:hypothetical protein